MAVSRTNTFPLNIFVLEKTIKFMKDNDLPELGIDALSKPDLDNMIKWTMGNMSDDDFIKQLSRGTGRAGSILPDDYFADDDTVVDEEDKRKSEEPTKRRRRE